MNIRTLSIFAPLVASCMLIPPSHAEIPSRVLAQASESQGYRWVNVSGTAIHYFTTAQVHSTQATDAGFIQRSTDIVELDGDLVGRVLYHVTSEFDFAQGTLVNTGNQVFSGSVLGSTPVLLHDDEFRVDVDLVGRSTYGRMFLVDHLAGPRIHCELEIFGQGQATPDGDALVDYSGRCRVRTPTIDGPIEP